MPKSVLFISYFFPPVGGAGVQRATKFVKYLPEFGWEPIVLTVQNPSVPVFDDSLSKEIPDSVKVYKARTLEPGYGTKQSVSASTEGSSETASLRSFFKKAFRAIAIFILQPDPQILWYPTAMQEAKKLIRSNEFDAIIATAPPFSSLLLGASLAKKFSIPLILDYRDEWDISNSVWENKKLGSVSLAIQKRMQDYAIRQASAIVATTKMSTEALNTKVRSANKHIPVKCIYNGYDNSDFESPNLARDAEDDKYLLSYVGTLWNLTSIAPLVAGLIGLSKEFPELAESIELAVAGRVTADQRSLLNELAGTPITLTLYDYISHDSALKLMCKSDGLCLLLSDMEMAKRVVPAKIFEYFASRNTIFCIAPEGEVWDLLSGHPRAFRIEPKDVDATIQSLVEEVRRFQRSGSAKVIGFDPQKYERRTLTGEMVELLNLVAE